MSKSNSNSKSDLLLYENNGLINFYKNDSNNLYLLKIIVNQDTKISLRLLDWLVTNYSKKKNVEYDLKVIDKDINGKKMIKEVPFNLWIDYKNQLKSYSKNFFDPFCRKQRIALNTKNFKVFEINEDEYDKYNTSENYIITTVGQLNFFKWAINKEVIEYAIKNLDSIEADMITCSNKHIKNNKNNTIGCSKRKTIIRFD